MLFFSLTVTNYFFVFPQGPYRRSTPELLGDHQAWGRVPVSRLHLLYDNTGLLNATDQGCT